MNELSELELRILSVLEELGSENVPAMMNTIFTPNNNSDQVEQIQTAISRLLKASLVEIQMVSTPTGIVPLSKEAAVTEISELRKHLSFVEAGRHWTDERMKGPPFFQIPVPEINRTNAGLQRGIEVLQTRGYQWWRN